MASKIQIPSINQSYYTSATADLVKNKMNAIKIQYGSIINNIAKLTKIPVDIILSIIFIESGGDSTSLSGAGAVGLMQVTPQTASDIIFLENKKGRLSATEKALLKKQLGTRLDCILSMKYMGHKLPCNHNTGVSVTRDDLYNIEFNILTGSIYLGILIDKYTEFGKIRLDKVIWAYNRGYFSKVPMKSISSLIAAAPTETKNYILKFVGKNSTLDILTA